MQARKSQSEIQPTAQVPERGRSSQRKAFHISGCTPSAPSISILRSQLRWLGHILRMSLGTDGKERLIKQAVRHIHSHRSEGDLLMDTPDVSWEQLQRAAADRDAWRQRVRALRMTPGTKWRNLVRRLLTKH